MELLIPELIRARQDNPDLPAARIRPGAPAGSLPDGLPADLRRLLSLSDGIRLGVRATVLPAEELPFYEYAETLARAAGIPNAADYLMIGTVNEAPLLLDTTDGSVWAARAGSGLWYQGCTLARLADGLDEFVSAWAAGPRFPELVETDDPDDLARDDWWRLLQAAGRVPA